MKKIAVILLIFIPFLVKSQTDTTRIPTEVAKQIVKDLVDYDLKKIELKKTQEILKTTEEVVISKDSSISIYKNKELNYFKQIGTERAKTEIWRQQFSQMQVKYKKEKAMRKLERVGLSIAIGILGYMYISK